MENKRLKILLIVLTAMLAAELIFLGVMHFVDQKEDIILSDPTGTSTESTQDTQPSDPTEDTTATETTESTETEPTESEPTEQRYVLTFVGDCTLGSTIQQSYSVHSFVQTVGEDYDYPFRNVAEYFKNDDFTMINLEVVFADEGRPADKLFAFRGPTAYTQILTGSSVEAVTLANNHSKDFGQEGYDTTKKVLGDAGVAYVEQNGSKMFTTESGLVIGMYAAAFNIDRNDMAAEIAQMRNNGAEIIIAAMHWGNEGEYRPTGDQQLYAKAAIDAGANIVYGHHPHVLQKIEEYNGGIIYYSLGNFSFGGNNFPQDLDSAVLQQEVIRELDGTIRLGELTIIPVSCSSMPVQNNFQPTPYEEGSKEYDRVISKLDGSFKGPNLVVDYEKETEPTEPSEGTDTTEPSAPSGETTPGGDVGGGDVGGDVGGGDVGGGDVGGGDVGGGDVGGGDVGGGDVGGGDVGGGDVGGGDVGGGDVGGGDVGGGDVGGGDVGGGDVGGDAGGGSDIVVEG